MPAPQDTPSVTERAVAMIQAGAWDDVLALLEPHNRPGQAQPSVLACQAWALAGLGRREEAENVVDTALQLEARNIRACLLKADLLTAREAHREANIFYRAVRELGGGQSNLPADIRDGVRRAELLQDRLTRDIFGHLRRDLVAAGYDETRSSSRFTQALDLASGKKTAYFQQPRNFFLPELAHVQFFSRALFPWLEALEAETDAITAELENLLADEKDFSPYLKTVPDLPSQSDYPLIDSMDWSSCFLVNGEPTPNAERCPRTMAALASVPLCRVPGRSPQVMFSQLKAGAHIRPHTGAVNTRLICHLPLIVPPNCKFRVGNEVRTWEKGKAWVFDDTIEHEAINQSDRNRVVLIFDIWRPELTEEERGLVSTLLESLDAYSSNVAAWD
jgi:aspartyl/asparaginyl beta-hydroxylase (cupin superfamily)